MHWQSTVEAWLDFCWCGVGAKRQRAQMSAPYTHTQTSRKKLFFVQCWYFSAVVNKSMLIKARTKIENVKCNHIPLKDFRCQMYGVENNLQLFFCYLLVGIYFLVGFIRCFNMLYTAGVVDPLALFYSAKSAVICHLQVTLFHVLLSLSYFCIQTTGICTLQKHFNKETHDTFACQITACHDWLKLWLCANLPFYSKMSWLLFFTNNNLVLERACEKAEQK